MKMLMRTIYKDENLILRHKIFKRSAELLTPPFAEIIKQDIVDLSPTGEEEHGLRFKQQWSVVQKEQMGYSFSNPAPYAHRIEYGTWPGTGPRTAEATHALTGEAGIFSTQTIRGGAAGVVGLYLSDENRIQWIADEITKRVREELGKLK